MMADIINLDDRRGRQKLNKEQQTVECIIDIQLSINRMISLIENFNKINPRIKNLNFIFIHLNTLNERLGNHLEEIAGSK